MIRVNRDSDTLEDSGMKSTPAHAGAGMIVLARIYWEVAWCGFLIPESSSGQASAE